ELCIISVMSQYFLSVHANLCFASELCIMSLYFSAFRRAEYVLCPRISRAPWRRHAAAGCGKAAGTKRTRAAPIVTRVILAAGRFWNSWSWPAEANGWAQG